MMSASDSSSTPDKFVQVLQPVLQHSNPSVTTVCTLLQVSSACRQVVQQTRLQCRIDWDCRNQLCRLAVFSRFCNWLAQHAGLVSQLNLTNLQPISLEHAEVSRNLLLLALQACTAGAAARTAATVAAGPAAAGGPAALGLPPALQLQHLQADIAVSPAIISALAGVQLRSLDLDLCAKQVCTALCSAFSALQTLEDLSIHWPLMRENTSKAFASCSASCFKNLARSLGHLRHLTRLHLEPAHPGGLQFLPPSLICLKVVGYSCKRAEAAAANACDNIQHLTALQKLTIDTDVYSIAHLQLPSELPALTLLGNARLYGQHRLCDVKLMADQKEGLHVLQDLSTYQHPWSLVLDASFVDMADEWAAGAPLQLCTSLTRLQLRDCTDEPDLGWAGRVAALANLVDLDLRSEAEFPEHLLRLSRLTALSRLALVVETGLNDEVATSLASHLTGLEHLTMICDEWQSAGVISVVAKLTKLQELHFIGSPWGHGIPAGHAFSACLTPVVLDRLRSLTQLRKLSLPLGAACPHEARQRFLDSMPGLVLVKNGCTIAAAVVP